MDIRKQKTRQAIQDAFLRLRAEKSLEQISVTELSRTAKISKATFYLHYRDIYDLSEQLQKAVIQRLLEQIDISGSPLDNWAAFTGRLMEILQQDPETPTILFAGAQQAMFPFFLEDQLRECILEQSPEVKEDLDLSVRLTYHIQGSYHAYLRHAHNADMQQILNIITDISNG